MIQSILSNLAIILLGHLLMSTLVDYKKKISDKVFPIIVVLLFSGVIISLFYLPISFGEYEEYRLDLRMIPLVFLAFFRGWRITLSVLIIATSWRLFMGGAGAITGVIFGMALPTLLALIVSSPNRTLKISWKDFWIVTVCWLISDTPIIFVMPNGLEVFKSVFIIRYLSILVVAFVYYTFILLAYKNATSQDKLKFLASHDYLTNLLNRNVFLERVEKRFSEQPMHHYILMIDIDHFKKLNDTYGHLAGDKVLQQFALLLKSYECEDLMVARYGGEEFIIYLKADDIEHPVKLVESIQNRIRATIFNIDSDKSVQITVSMGMAKIKSEDKLQEVISQADENLYIAKENNRDQLIVS